MSAATHPLLEVCCWECDEGKEMPGMSGLPVTACVMIVCPDCGNKRCPKASNHLNACSGSNRIGQAGSVFG